VKALLIETATPACAVGLYLDGAITTVVEPGDREHTEQLMPAIVTLLADQGVRLADLDRVIVDRGPGLFTGMRVGLATAAALAQANDAALVGVTSLELYAHDAHAAGVRGTLLAAVDGRRGELFVQQFTLDDTVTAASEPAVTTATDVLITWGTLGAPATITGDGVARYFDLLAPVPNFTVLERDVPSVREGLLLGVAREPNDVLPLYLRDADAVANFTVRTRS